LYSFRDIIVLKVIKRLLDAGVSLRNIRKAVEALRSRGVRDLAEITLMSDGSTVYECRSAGEVIDLLRGGQGVFGIAVRQTVNEVMGRLSALPSGEGPPSPPEQLPVSEAPDRRTAAS
jgi:DNA-binding transcriptional MerR regulator